MAAWLPLRDAGAVVSHESALELHGLSDVLPHAIHLTLPRSERGQRRRTGVRLHTLNRPPTKAEVRTVEGLPVTSPERTIVDALETGAQPEQIEMAIGQALERGLTTPRRLTEATSGRSARVREFTERRLKGTLTAEMTGIPPGRKLPCTVSVPLTPIIHEETAPQVIRGAVSSA